MKQVVSSKWTLLLKWFFPVIWGIFVGGFTIYLTFFEDLSGLEAPLTPTFARILFISSYFTVLGFWYVFFFRVKWAALDTEHIYFSNFFSHYRYTYDSIAGIEERRVLGARRIYVHFYEQGSLGKVVHFIANHYWDYYLEKHPEVVAQLVRQKDVPSASK